MKRAALARTLLALVLFAGAGGCEDPQGPAPAAAPEPVGGIDLGLEVGSGIRIDSVDYDITGGAFHKTGRLDVQGRPVISASIGGIPLGTGYQIALTATDVDHRLTDCHGASSFDLTAPTTVPVTVHLQCREVRAMSPPAQAVPLLSPVALLALAGLLLVAGALVLRRRASR
jgi:hypothetical protein